ncbi:unnamed protein product [Linum trigynum]
MIPMTDMARLQLNWVFKSKPWNSPVPRLPEGCENAIKSPDLMILFFKSMAILQRPFDDLLRLWRRLIRRQHMVFAGLQKPPANSAFWALLQRNTIIHRIFTSYLKLHEPYKGVKSASDSEPFFLSGFLHEIQLTKIQLPPFLKGDESDIGIRELREQMEELKVNSFGVVVNSFPLSPP